MSQVAAVRDDDHKPEIQPLLDVYAAAKFLDRSVNSMYIDCRAGLIPHYRVGNSLRFDLDELRAWLEANRRGPVVKP